MWNDFLIQKRVAIYCRCSTDRQELERQRRELTEFAHRAGYEIVGVFEEVASGSKDERVQRKKVLALAQARKIDIVLVTEVSRWGRSTIDLLNTAQELRTRDVSIVAQSGLQFDFDTPQGKLMYTMMAGLAEFERDLTRERIKSGLAAARAKGKLLGRQPGQSPKRIKRIEGQVKQFASDGKSYRWIAKELHISTTTVTRILKPRALKAMSTTS